ncbi:hypothetical protein FOXG_17787 [Fusarium oxysporum f. sp. lycopersici 4287]|uniref:Uncharacterized protein n=2 Tax=Fusarium oxysporum TaxID=5507 RepID=A0A0J9U3N2_FUSO4|nr:hypothetical protein FOXG_17787 [Fusarium oxysporum f. sp. lycopersici 4287]EXK47127.1 hypothetical protein FOMG_00668 [Fusarium oxysporum f. sp. melonis 26406]KNA93529.1 hypothetical protein FOXG_17787 [Fusarium oxysporum f. sp. lycopersici 4287]
MQLNRLGTASSFQLVSGQTTSISRSAGVITAGVPSESCVWSLLLRQERDGVNYDCYFWLPYSVPFHTDLKCLCIAEHAKPGYCYLNQRSSQQPPRQISSVREQWPSSEVSPAL